MSVAATSSAHVPVKICKRSIQGICTQQASNGLKLRHSPSGHVTHIHLGMSSCCAAEVFAASTDLPDGILTEGVLAEGESLEEAAGKE